MLDKILHLKHSKPLPTDHPKPQGFTGTTVDRPHRMSSPPTGLGMDPIIRGEETWPEQQDVQQTLRDQVVACRGFLPSVRETAERDKEVGENGGYRNWWMDIRLWMANDVLLCFVDDWGLVDEWSKLLIWVHVEDCWCWLKSLLKHPTNFEKITLSRFLGSCPTVSIGLVGTQYTWTTHDGRYTWWLGGTSWLHFGSETAWRYLPSLMIPARIVMNHEALCQIRNWCTSIELSTPSRENQAVEPPKSGGGHRFMAGSVDRSDAFTDAEPNLFILRVICGWQKAYIWFKSAPMIGSMIVIVSMAMMVLVRDAPKKSPLMMTADSDVMRMVDLMVTSTRKSVYFVHLAKPRSCRKVCKLPPEFVRTSRT